MPELDPASRAYAERQGMLCARVRWTPLQIIIPVIAGAAFLAWAWQAPLMAWTAASMAVAALASATVGLRLVAMAAAWRRDPSLAIATDEIAALDRAALPAYTLLVPLYREPEVVPHLVAALAVLDYPRDRLEALILVEPDDAATAAALAAAALPAWMRVVTSPVGLPRTKPRACNAGLAQARGELLVIYDAEDRPEPDQLLKAVAAYRRLPAEVVCLQCRLDHYNSRQSLAARWATVDYLVWFRHVLPGLERLGAPLPLGGTSNHFRTAALRDLDGWDPFNVTEDCDLGMRIARRGWRTRMLASTTWEEAVTTVPAWVRQRSRWIKGHAQTWLVQSRRGALRAFGWHGTALMALNTAGVMATLLVNPLAWAVVALWLAVGWSVVDARDPWSVAGLVVSAGLLLANLVLAALAVAACLRSGRRDLVAAAAGIPAAWALQSLAAWRAAWELAVRPFHWAKTRHGAAVPDAAPGRRLAAAPLVLAGIAGAALLLMAAWRIDDDLRRQAGVPVQSPLACDPLGPATALVGAATDPHPAPWRGAVAADAPPSAVAEPALRAMADLGAVPLALTSSAVRDLGGAAAVACDVLVEAEAPNGLGIAAHWRDEDGRWFQRLSPQRLIPGTWTRVEFPLREAWDALGHRRAWHPDLLRRASELGLAFSGGSYRGAVTVANLRLLAAPPAAPPRCTLLQAPPATLPVLARWRLDADLGRSWSNPCDPAEVALDAEFTAADGAVERVPAFYFQDYQRSLVGGREELAAVGAPCWRADWRARRPGRYAWRLLLSDHGGSATTVASGACEATPAAAPGYLRRSPADPTLFTRDDGSFAYPIGENLVQAVDKQQPFPYPFAVPPDQGTYTYDRYLERMAGAGMNLARLWMTPWSFGIEGDPRWRDFHGLGRYNLANAWRLDHVLDTAGARGIDIVLTVSHQSEFQTAWGSLGWLDSAFNPRTGGFLADPGDFFADPRVLAAYRQRLRYMIARWGDRPNLAAWELFGECNLFPRYDAEECARWHAAMIASVRRTDVYRHLVFTHTHNWQEGYPLWGLPEVDCVQGNGYIRPPNRSPDHVANFDRYLAEVRRFAKPVLVAEYGGRSELGAPSADYLLAQMHSGLWASFARPFAGAALHWWWNFTDGADLYGHYRGLAAFARGIDRLARAYRPVDPPFPPGSGLVATGMQAADAGFYWIHDPAIFERWDGLPVRTGAVLRLSGLRPGRYRVECWDTLGTAALSTASLDSDGGLAVALPAVTRDLAVKVIPDAAASPAR